MVHFSRNTRRRLPRTGMVIVAIIALLAVATMLFGVGAKSVLQEHRQIGQRELSIQSRRLAEAGLARAEAQLAVDESYDGEVWEISVKQLGGKHAGQVTIRLPEGDSEKPRQVISEAAFPIGGLYRSTTTLEQAVVAEKPSPKASPDEIETGDKPDDTQ